VTVSYFSGRTHLEAVEHAARIALKQGEPAYVGTVKANPWVGPDEPVRYARWVTTMMPSWATWRDRVVHLACIRPEEAQDVLTKVSKLRTARERRRMRWDRGHILKRA
jgi:hypothetical protein